MPPRRLILIWSNASDAVTQAQALLAPLPPTQTAWINQPGQGRQTLGRTLAAAVIDANAPLMAEDIGAIAGTLIAGGALILLLPSAPQSGFTQWLINQVARLSWVEHVDGNQPPPPAIRPASVIAESPLSPTPDQQRAIVACRAALQTPGTEPLLITADRGRGKSTALGLMLAAGQWPDARLTGPSRAAVATVIAHAGDYAPTFAPPEDITPSDAPLVVDEAAALPLGLLQRLIRDNPRCVLAGTVHGYEGSGRGVLLRLPAQRLTLNQPVRWTPDDPLEAFIDALLLLKPSPIAVSGYAEDSGIQWVNRSQLLTIPNLLPALWGLLIESHYQTRPRDLQQLIEDPALHIAVAVNAGKLMGVATAREEGGLDRTLADPIWLGQRRPQGHLIAQSLSFHAGLRGASSYHGLRLQRIAVDAAHRRSGIGKQLIAAMQAMAARHRKDWFGTSFSATPELLDFWRATGLEPVRLGHRHDPQGGERAVIMLTGLNTAGKALMTQARTRFALHLPDQIAQAQPPLSPALLQRLTTELPIAEPSAIDQEDLIAFAHGHRQWFDSFGAIQRLARQQHTTVPARVEAALKHPHRLAQLAVENGFSGRRAYLDSLREWTATMINCAP